MDTPDLTWDAHGLPFSKKFSDHYFDRHDGLAESNYVFLRHNNLPEAWHEHKLFTIGELGFGTGLNFFATWELWQEHRPLDGHLHFLSVEGFPLTPEDILNNMRHWPDLLPLAAKLAPRLPPPISGFHRINLEEDGLSLTLLLGPVRDMLSQLQCTVDAWYLDGFAPSKNPDMWSPEVMAQLARTSRTGTTFATFTAAGQVRRNLQEAGFHVRKSKGFVNKREMLSGHAQENTSAFKDPTPWFSRPLVNPKARTALVIGAGLAGATTAHALATRGWSVTVLDQHPAPAQEASGNPAGYLAPLVTPSEDLLGRFLRNAYLYAKDYWLIQGERPERFSGILQLCHDARWQRRHTWIEQDPHLPHWMAKVVDANEASQLAGTAIVGKTLFLPNAGWLEPQRQCRKLLQETPGITTRHAKVARLAQEENAWQAYGDDGTSIAKSDVAILATGHATNALLNTEALSLDVVRGQLTYFPAAPHTPNLKLPVTGDSYILPAIKDESGRLYHAIGATFQKNDQEKAPRSTDHQHNLAGLKEHMPGFLSNEQNSDLEGRVAFRAVTPDHYPIVGPVPHWQSYTEAYDDIAHGKKHYPYPPAPYLPGLYLSTGHGARGLTTTPIAAELLAALINNEPLPMEQRLCHAVHPGRFLIRSLKRGTQP